MPLMNGIATTKMYQEIRLQLTSITCRQRVGAKSFVAFTPPHFEMVLMIEYIYCHMYIRGPLIVTWTQLSLCLVVELGFVLLQN